jgi:dolichol-phosphate mannosyltransferase
VIEGSVRPPGRQLLSVVAPLHDEEDTIAAFHGRTVAALEGLEFELVLVDDGSADATGARLRELAAADERVKVIALSRNFGHQAALSAGLEHARGDVVVMLDADLQDPPELIPEMLDAWRRGADVVYAVRQSRAGETRFKIATAHWFYRVFARLAGIELAHDSGDFRLMDRAPLDALLSMPERTRFLRGMTVWVGFTQTAVPYQRAARAGGRSKFTLARMLRFAFDAITSFSHAPLQAATLLGFAFSILAFLAIPLAVAARYADIYSRGVPTTIVIVLLLGGIQLITVGIIGEYVGRIYDEVKHRPLYVVRDRVNVDAPDEDRAGTR